MIVKDEESVLKRCLDSVKEACDEIIIVDTGSKDRTQEIVKAYPKTKLYHFKWIEDFAAARNESFKHATQDLILWLDADDIIKPDSVQVLIDLKKKPLAEIAECYITPYQYALDGHGNVLLGLQRERIFKRSVNPTWKYRIHECVPLSFAKMEQLKFEVYHHKTQAHYKRAEGRNLKILKECCEDPKQTNSRYEFYYGKELVEIGQLEEAEKYLSRFLEHWEFWEDAFWANYKLAEIAYQQKRHQAAFNQCFDALKLDQNRAEIYCLLGLTALSIDRLDLAEFWYKAALVIPRPKENFGFYTLDYYSFIPHTQLCVIYDKLGDYEKSLIHAQKALSYRPDDPNCLHNVVILKKLLGKKSDNLFAVYIPFQYDANNPNVRIRKLNVLKELNKRGFEANLVQRECDLLHYNYVLSHVRIPTEILRRLRAQGTFVGLDYAEGIFENMDELRHYDAIWCCSEKIKKECEPFNTNATHIPDSFET